MGNILVGTAEVGIKESFLEKDNRGLDQRESNVVQSWESFKN